MAATYGYGGEFSSDEDIDRMEQQSERLVHSKFDAFSTPKPTKHQVEEAIETIRLLPVEQDVNISDELLAGLLDHYKTKRGPIVDSTRNLYKKIILKHIRGEQQPQQANGDPVTKDSNGNNNNNIVDPKRVEASSDEDEPMPPVSSQSSNDAGGRKKLDSRVVLKNNEKIEEPMEVDSEALAGIRQNAAIRNVKPVDLSTSEDSDSETEDSSGSSDSEVIDVTPVKPSSVVVPKAAGVTPAAAQKAAEQSTKKPLTSTPKSKAEPAAVDAKKPYTRSQRAAISRATSKDSDKKEDAGSSKVEKVTSSGASKLLSKSSLTSYQSCSRGLSKVKLEEPFKLNVTQDENGEILQEGTTINGRKLNYAEKMVLKAMITQKQRNKAPAILKSKS